MAARDGIILVVEDDRDFRETVEMVLRYAGFEVVGAGNGAEALRWLRSTDTLPSLILLDLRMPTMDGWTFRQQQKRDAHLSAIPVVALSSEYFRTARDAGVDAAAVLRKPVDVGTLVGTVERCAA